MKKKSNQLLQAKLYKEQHPNDSIASIAKLFKVDRGALTRTINDATNYNIDGHDGYHYFFTPDEWNIINSFIENPHLKIETLKKQQKSNLKSGTLKRWLEILGIIYEPHYKFGYNRDAFNEIISEEDAYWLGFITADGYLNESHNWLNIGLGERDVEHLRKFLRYVGCSEEEIPQLIKSGYGGAYTRDNLVYSITLCSKKIVENLKRYGLFQAKSGREIPYICKDKQLEIAYLRGLLDGDGYIRDGQYGLGLVGSYEIVNYFKQFILQNLPNCLLDDANYIHPHGVIYKFAIGGKLKAINILHLLYDNSTIYLDRKYELYKQYCRE